MSHCIGHYIGTYSLVNCAIYHLSEIIRNLSGETSSICGRDKLLWVASLHDILGEIWDRQVCFDSTALERKLGMN